MDTVQQLYTNCLAQGAYFLSSEGEAAVIDPLRDIDTYVKMAEELNVEIKYVFETHFHADFVSGHLDLAEQTGATIVYGPGASTEFEKYSASDGEEFEVGDLTIRAIHTPGHTMESTCYLLLNAEKEPHAVFTGDTLFVGDVGRPDLAQKGGDMSTNDMASMLFDSLRQKLMTLPDQVIVYPAHGAGSACGKHMSKETTSTIGAQKVSNYALRPDMTRAEFIAEVTTDLAQPPQYFAKNVTLNKSVLEDLNAVVFSGIRPLDADAFRKASHAADVLILDVRAPLDFLAGHIPDALFVGLDGTFAPWVGAIVPDIAQKILLVAPKGREEEAITRLARVGYDNTIGYLEGSMEAWVAAGNEIRTSGTIPMESFIQKLEGGQVDQVVDVRKPGEFSKAHLSSAVNFPLDDWGNGELSTFARDRRIVLHCAGGYRATIVASLLLQQGIAGHTHVMGKFSDLRHSGLPMEGNCDTLKHQLQ